MKPEEGINARNLANNLMEPIALFSQLGPNLYDLFVEVFGSESDIKEQIETITIGGLTAKEVLSKAQTGDLNEYSVTSEMVESILYGAEFTKHTEKPQDYSIVRIRMSELGINTYTDLRNVYKIAKNYGLKFCPQDMALHLIFDKNVVLRKTGDLIIASEPILTKNGSKRLLTADKFSKFCLGSIEGDENARITQNYEMVFCLPKVIKKK
jgi:hypothetical protein